MAYLETGRTHIEIEPTEGATRIRVAEIRGWGDTSAASKTDISIIGNLNASGKNVKRYKAGSVENAQTLTAFYDPTDSSQALLVAGYKFYRAYVVEDTVDRVIYNDCEVLSRNKNGQEIDGLVGMDLTITVNSDITDVLEA